MVGYSLKSGRAIAKKPVFLAPWRRFANRRREMQVVYVSMALIEGIGATAGGYNICF
jgi:hypothetical protein